MNCYVCVGCSLIGLGGTGSVALLVYDQTGALAYIHTYEGNSISKLQIVIEKNRMEIMTYKQHLFFNIISIQI